MKKDKMNEDEIQILGYSKQKRSNKPLIIIGTIVVLAISLVGVFYYRSANSEPQIAISNPITTTKVKTDIPPTSYIEVLEETVNDVPLFVYVPHNVTPELTADRPDVNDNTIVFATQAADVGVDNEGIVGDFILAGKQISRGKSKLGFCSIIGNEISIGATTSTPLFDKAKEDKGYFFRQYPLVSKGQLVENKPKGKAIRRALGKRNNTVVIVESRSRESFYDFAQSLIDIGISDAIYLVGGSNVFYWYLDIEGNKNIFGTTENDIAKSLNYIVWKK